MKISKSLLFKISFILYFGLISLSAFADGAIVIIKKDDPIDPPPPHPQLMESEIPVSAYENNINLSIYFDLISQQYNLTVIDENNTIVYQNTVSSGTLDIDIEAWETGSYTLYINYGTTELYGEFDKEN